MIVCGCGARFYDAWGSCASDSGSGAIRLMMLVGGLRVLASLARVFEHVICVDAVGLVRE